MALVKPLGTALAFKAGGFNANGSCASFGERGLHPRQELPAQALATQVWRGHHPIQIEGGVGHWRGAKTRITKGLRALVEARQRFVGIAFRLNQNRFEQFERARCFLVAKGIVRIDHQLFQCGAIGW